MKYAGFPRVRVIYHNNMLRTAVPVHVGKPPTGSSSAIAVGTFQLHIGNSFPGKFKFRIAVARIPDTGIRNWGSAICHSRRSGNYKDGENQHDSHRQRNRSLKRLFHFAVPLHPNYSPFFRAVDKHTAIMSAEILTFLLRFLSNSPICMMSPLTIS